MAGSKHRLADLQMAIMQTLWSRGESTVAEVRESLAPDRELAHTTVGTMLARMESQGLVTHRSVGRANLYQAATEPEQVKRSMVSDLAERLFAGDVTDLVCHLLDGCEISRDELANLKKLIRQKEKELADD
jgi:BlaI family penicillinase repressor